MFKKTRKGVRGFLQVPEHLKKSKAMVFRLTPSEYDTLSDYCFNNGFRKVDVLKTALNEFYERNNVSIQNKEIKNPNQLTITEY